MNIYIHELKSLRKQTIVWTFSMTALALIYFSVYQGIVKDIVDFRQLMSNYPASVRAMLGISLDNITTVLGFYSIIFSLIILCAAIQSMNFGLSILSKEGRERTADFLLVKPLSRFSIVTSKLLAAVTMLICTNVVYSMLTSIIANSVKTADYSQRQFLMINATILFVQIIFLTLGMFISVFYNNLKSVIPISLGFVFGFYILGALLVTKSDDLARYFFPFKYFDNAYILKNSSYEMPYLVMGAIIVIVAITATYIIYKKKDIHAVN